MALAPLVQCFVFYFRLVDYLDVFYLTYANHLCIMNVMRNYVILLGTSKDRTATEETRIIRLLKPVPFVSLPSEGLFCILRAPNVIHTSPYRAYPLPIKVVSLT